MVLILRRFGAIHRHAFVDQLLVKVGPRWWEDTYESVSATPISAGIRPDVVCLLAPFTQCAAYRSFNTNTTRIYCNVIYSEGPV